MFTHFPGSKYRVKNCDLRRLSCIRLVSPAGRHAFILPHCFKVEDWMPTLLSAAGYNMTSLPRDKLYGIDQWDVLVSRTGQKGVSEPSEPVDAYEIL